MFSRSNPGLCAFSAREGSRQQDAANEQRQRERDLDHDQDVARARLTDASRWWIASPPASRSRSARHACAAGSSVAIRPVSDSTAIDASSTSMLTRMFSTRGSVGGASGMNALTA